MGDNRVFCLMGPTASGKTALACELAQYFPFEIISVDSAMIYRGMDIGTSKPSITTLQHAPHHLIDIRNPPESYSAAEFCNDVTRLHQAIHDRQKIPLLVGGTMMYFRALQQGLASLPQADDALRQQLLSQANQYGWDFMHKQLAQVDASSAARIHPHDTQRIQRALEVFYLTNKPLSVLLQNQTQGSSWRYINIVLMPTDRFWLHERIEWRFNQMIKQGLVEEVQGLLAQWDLMPAHPALRSVGYRQIYDYLCGKADHNSMCAKAIAATRQLAKRQLTWLRHWPDSVAFSAEDCANPHEIIAIIKQILDNP